MKLLEWTIYLIISLLLIFNIIIELNNEEIKIVEKDIVVEIKGSVKNPGIYKMDTSKRVNDLIEVSGGLVESATTDNINLSARLTDEMVVVIDDNSIKYIENECICPIVKSLGCLNYKETINISKKISINNATITELTSLPGIGEKKAETIIEYRNLNGSFNNIEEIKLVKGIGKALYEKIKDYITL